MAPHGAAVFVSPLFWSSVRRRLSPPAARRTNSQMAKLRPCLYTDCRTGLCLIFFGTFVFENLSKFGYGDYPDLSVISKLLNANGMTDVKLGLIASVFPDTFPTRLPNLRSRTNTVLHPMYLLRVHRKRSTSASSQDADWWTTLTGSFFRFRFL